MYDEDVPDVGDVPARKITDAAEKAREALWMSIANDFPEVKTGDLDPGQTIGLEMAVNDVLVAWLRFNHPSVNL